MTVPITGVEQHETGITGVVAFTTTRAAGSFGFGTGESVKSVFGRWSNLQSGLRSLGIDRLACASQVHGADIAVHGGSWHGWLRLQDVDGHITQTPGTAMAVTVADCTPVFVAHPEGAVAVLHAGWRGTAARILESALGQMAALGFDPLLATVHLGPSICGACYEVGPEVLTAVHGTPASKRACLDVRAVLMEQARRLKVSAVTVSTSCTRHDNDTFFSHRAGDEGRQLGVIALLPRYEVANR